MVTVEHTERPAIPWPSKLRRRAWMSQLTSFGLVGAIAFVVDFSVYNVLRTSLLSDSPIWSKVASVAVATLVAWVGNRYLTFRTTRGRPVLREAVLFAAMNVVGLLIASACLFVSHYVLGFTSQLADNVSGNGIGLVLGTAFRFVAYRALVFRSEPDRPTASAQPEPIVSAGVEHATSNASALSASALTRSALTPERV